MRDLTLVSPSLWLAGLVGESFLKNYPVEVIPNGIDLGAFKLTPGDFRQRHGLDGKFVMLGELLYGTSARGIRRLWS